MLIVTNRRFKEGPSGTLPDGSPPPLRSVTLDPDDTGPSAAVCFCGCPDQDDDCEIYGSRCMDRLKNTSSKHVLLYIHGFDMLPQRDIFARAGI